MPVWAAVAALVFVLAPNIDRVGSIKAAKWTVNINSMEAGLPFNADAILITNDSFDFISRARVIQLAGVPSVPELSISARTLAWRQHHSTIGLWESLAIRSHFARNKDGQCDVAVNNGRFGVSDIGEPNINAEMFFFDSLTHDSPPDSHSGSMGRCKFSVSQSHRFIKMTKLFTGRPPQGSCEARDSERRNGVNVLAVSMNEVASSCPEVADRTKEEDIKGGAVFWGGVVVILAFIWWTVKCD